MATRAQKIRLALFLVFSTCVLAGFLLIVAGAQLLRQRVVYNIEFEDSIGGLTAGDPVKYQGVTVGRVENTHVSADDISIIVVEISLEAKKVPSAIREDTQARLFSQGVTGLKYIELVAGSVHSPALPPGATIPARATFLANAEERADVMLNKIETLLGNLGDLTNADNRRQFSQLLSAGGKVMVNANNLLAQNEDDLHATLRNLALITDNLAATTGSMRATMDSLHNAVAAEEMRQTATNLRLTVEALRHQLEGPVPELLAQLTSMAGNINTTVTHVDNTVLQGRKNILDAMEDLEETLLNVRQASELIREDPSILIRGRAED
ncbi:MAG: MCE family protein [Gemmatimonadetes bacterium]|nr:MCE family protein [Gemmatimonadota bacterium]